MSRLDVALVERGLAASRTQAQAAIIGGYVSVNDAPCRRPAEKIASDAILSVDPAATPQYASRAGIKLAAALDAFAVDPRALPCLDIGASTGGFTDCLLQRGAASVTAVDVGKGQLTPRLAADPRVRVRDGVNARDLLAAGIPGPYPLIVADVSFISLALIIPSVTRVLANPAGRFVALIKPQFEVGAGNLGAGGIVRDAALRESAVAAVTQSAAQHGLERVGLIESPITGGDGNIEFLAAFRFSS